MKPQPPTHDLDTLLRDGATHRRATLDELAPAYPVGDYPAKRPEHRAELTGPGPIARLVWLVGLGTASTAGFLGLVTLVSLLVLPDPTRPTAPLLAADPQPANLGESVRSLAAGLGELEAQMDQTLNPSIQLATELPAAIGGFPAALADAEAGLQRPLEAEFAALRADLQTAANHIRRQWADPPAAAPTGHLIPGGDSIAG